MVGRWIHHIQHAGSNPAPADHHPEYSLSRTLTDTSSLQGPGRECYYWVVHPVSMREGSANTTVELG